MNNEVKKLKRWPGFGPGHGPGHGPGFFVQKVVQLRNGQRNWPSLIIMQKPMKQLFDYEAW